MKKYTILENEIIDIRTKMGLITEATLPIIQEGDTLCDILCGRKQAKYGSNGTVVKQIQHALNKCGFNVEKQGGGINQACKTSVEGCDGLFRKETKLAVEQFQKANGLTVDGSVGYKTLTAMASGNASSKGGCLDLPKCNCKTQTKGQDKIKDSTPTKGKTDWWNLIDTEIPNKDCDTINKCLYLAISKCKSSNDQRCFQKTFYICMGGKKDRPVDIKNNCGDCPEYINRMPGPGRKALTQFEDRCIKSGCSKVAQ